MNVLTSRKGILGITQHVRVAHPGLFLFFLLCSSYRLALRMNVFRYRFTLHKTKWIFRTSLILTSTPLIKNLSWLKTSHWRLPMRSRARFPWYIASVSRALNLSLMCHLYNQGYPHPISKKLGGFCRWSITPRCTRVRKRCLDAIQTFDWNIRRFDWTWNAVNDLFTGTFTLPSGATDVLPAFFAFYAYAKAQRDVSEV